MLYETHKERIDRFCQSGLYMVTGQSLSVGRPTEEIVRCALDGGCRLIQMREKNLSVRELVSLGKKLRAMTAAADALLIVNDRLDVAQAIGADGVHLGNDDLPVKLARRVAPEMIIGASSHNVAEAAEAQAFGASYVNIGPIYPTQTKVWQDDYLGTAGIAEISAVLDIPFTVMGGIKLNHIHELWEAGAHTMAVVTAVTAADDPAKATRELLTAIQSHYHRHERADGHVIPL